MTKDLSDLLLKKMSPGLQGALVASGYAPHEFAEYWADGLARVKGAPIPHDVGCALWELALKSPTWVGARTLLRLPRDPGFTAATKLVAFLREFSTTLTARKEKPRG